MYVDIKSETALLYFIPDSAIIKTTNTDSKISRTLYRSNVATIDLRKTCFMTHIIPKQYIMFKLRRLRSKQKLINHDTEKLQIIDFNLYNVCRKVR